MDLVRSSGRSLMEEAVAGTLHTRLAEQSRVQYNASVGAGEVRSWQKSLPAFLTDLADAGLSHVEVLLEYKLPYSPKRVDVLLCGTHPARRTPSYVLVELKQWTNVEQVADGLVRVPHYGSQPVLHPVDQVRGYCEYLVDFTPALAEGDGAVHGIAYLHNAAASGWRLGNYKVDGHGRLYTGEDRGELVAELRRLLDPDPSTAEAARRAADNLQRARHEPTKQLLAVASKEVRERE